MCVIERWCGLEREGECDSEIERVFVSTGEKEGVCVCVCV